MEPPLPPHPELVEERGGSGRLPVAPVAIPLADCADRALASLAALTGSTEIAALSGGELLGERAVDAGFAIPGRVCAGGGCRLYDARGDAIALNLSRADDRELLPALFEDGGLDPADAAAVADHIAHGDAAALVARGRLMGLAIAAVHERRPGPAAPWTTLTAGLPAPPERRRRPRVLDLSALWAGPLAGRLLQLAGAEVTKLESLARPDAMREGQPRFYARLNGGKAHRALDFRTEAGVQALLALIAEADIVIEAARPRALRQLGVDADRLVRETPGLVWLSITGHGAEGEAGGWVGFGDDCGVSGGLSAALLAATGQLGFVGDAIADPLTGVHAALCGWKMWSAGRGGRLGLAMSEVVAHCLDRARTLDPGGLEANLRAWSRALGRPFVATREPAPC